MHVRILVIFVFIGLFFVGIVSGASTDYEKTDYLGKDALPTVNDALDLNTAITSLTNDVTDFGLSSILKSGDDWVDEADKLKIQNAQLHDQLKNTQDSGARADLADKLIKNYQLITKANKLAIIKYSEDNSKGKNDNKISQRHLAISQNLDAFAIAWNSEHERSSDSKIDQMSLAALEAATEADMTNVKAWDARIKMLQDMGRYDEADDVRDEMNSRVGSTAIGMFLPLGSFTALFSIVLAGLSFVVSSRRKGAKPVN